eukprot:a2651_67.p1 GENE.a2651_67~~a2651_67.p1  ORF type:complete len:384 (+),score=94.47 a2651_67:67-1152(+)
MGATASADTKQYRQGYPGLVDDPTKSKNLEFYMNARPSEPDGDFIDNIHAKWFGNYKLLERHHGYIQWLFPIKEKGMNSLSQRLHEHEAVAIRASPEMQARVVRSYELMLDFYGMVLVDKTTGEVGRNEKNWRSQYRNLSAQAHNFLRITRILKCLGELGFEHYKVHFVAHVIREIQVNDLLVATARSCEHYWAPVLRRKTDRKALKDLAERLETDRNARLALEDAVSAAEGADGVAGAAVMAGAQPAETHALAAAVSAASTAAEYALTLDCLPDTGSTSFSTSCSMDDDNGEIVPAAPALPLQTPNEAVFNAVESRAASEPMDVVSDATVPLSDHNGVQSQSSTAHGDAAVVDAAPLARE